MQNAGIEKIHFTPHFIKSYKKLPGSVQNLAKTREEIFKKNPFDSRLCTHRMKGELSLAWAYSVNYRYR